MGFRLRAGLTFCLASDRLVFLDIDRDRYFCLAHSTETAFRRLIGGEHLSDDDGQWIGRLQHDGLLVETAGREIPKPCGDPDPVRLSLLETAPSSVPLRETAAAFVHLAAAEARLRFRALRHTIAWLERAKHSSKRPPVHVDQQLLTIAAAFQKTSFIATPLNKCLPRTIAVASRCLALGVAPTVVIAVKLQPFAAHCWVQHDGLLVNEQLDRVREFVPIRLI